MAEITPKGYNLKTVNDWFVDERQLYLDIDPSWNLDPSTPDGLKIAHDSEVFGALDETLQQAYNSKDPNKAGGYDLDILSALTGTTRSEGSYSTVTGVILTGVPNTTRVPAGTRFKSSTTGSVWTLNQSWTLDNTGNATVDMTSSVIGAVELQPNTLTVIVDTVGGLISVNNPSAATPGTGVESDNSLRVKRSTAVGKPGNNQVDSMLGELFAVKAVRRAKIEENDTNSSAVSEENPHGLPAHSISVIVDGGTDQDVAMAIYIKKNPGVYLNQAGTPVSVMVTSPTYSNNVKLIKFSRPVYIDIVMNVVVKDDGNLPSATILESLIREAVLEFSLGNLIPADVGFKIDGFDIGESVYYSTMFTPVNQVIGQYGNPHVQSMTLNGSMGDVTIEYNQLSRWTSSNITVSIV